MQTSLLSTFPKVNRGKIYNESFFIPRHEKFNIFVSEKGILPVHRRFNTIPRGILSYKGDAILEKVVDRKGNEKENLDAIEGGDLKEKEDDDAIIKKVKYRMTNIEAGHFTELPNMIETFYSNNTYCYINDDKLVFIVDCLRYIKTIDEVYKEASIRRKIIDDEICLSIDDDYCYVMNHIYVFQAPIMKYQIGTFSLKRILTQNTFRCLFFPSAFGLLYAKYNSIDDDINDIEEKEQAAKVDKGFSVYKLDGTCIFTSSLEVSLFELFPIETVNGFMLVSMNLNPKSLIKPILIEFGSESIYFDFENKPNYSPFTPLYDYDNIGSYDSVIECYDGNLVYAHSIVLRTFTSVTEGSNEYIKPIQSSDLILKPKNRKLELGNLTCYKFKRYSDPVKVAILILYGLNVDIDPEDYVELLIIADVWDCKLLFNYILSDMMSGNKYKSCIDFAKKKGSITPPEILKFYSSIINIMS